MRLPHLQIYQKFIQAQAPLIAAIVRRPVALIIGMGVQLFAFTVEQTSTDEKPPDGIFLHPDASRILEGVMGWDGEEGKLAAAFEAAGVLEKLEVGLRVRGCDRYAAAWGKAAKDRDRWRNGRELAANSQRTRSDSPRQTQTQTQIEEEARAPQPKATRPPPPAPGPNGDAPAALAWLGWANEQRLATFPGALDLMPQSHEVVAFWREAAPALAAGGEERLKAAWRGFLADAHWSENNPPCPWGAWRKQWAGFVESAAKVATRPKVRRRKLEPPPNATAAELAQVEAWNAKCAAAEAAG